MWRTRVAAVHLEGPQSCWHRCDSLHLLTLSSSCCASMALVRSADEAACPSVSLSSLLKVESSGAGRLLPHGVVLRSGLRPQQEGLRLGPLQSTGPAGEEDRPEPGQVLLLLHQHVQNSLQTAPTGGRRYCTQ